MATTRFPSQRRRRAPRPVAVKREESRLVFTRDIDPLAHRQFMWCLSDCLEKGYQDIVLDLSQCQRAYPNGVLPVITSIDALRTEGLDVSVVLPEDEELRRLFSNANWAHLLAPEVHPASETPHPRHVPARRFRDAEQQHSLVGEARGCPVGC